MELPVPWFKKRIADNDEFGDLSREMEQDTALKAFPDLSWSEFEMHLKMRRHVPTVVFEILDEARRLSEAGI